MTNAQQVLRTPHSAFRARQSVAVSIIIVSYNSRDHLARCLPAVARTVGANCEVIVVDNASPDGSADYIATSFPWVRLIRSSINAGFAAGNHLGVAAARGEYIVALNPDTAVTPGWLEALLRPLQMPPAPGAAPVGLTTARILLMDSGDRVNTCGNIMHISGITVCRGLDRPADAPELAVPCAVSAVSGACFALPRRLWDTLGGFDPTFFTYLEDTDLSVRAHLAGYRAEYVPDAVVYHSYTAGFSARKLYYLERNRLLLLLKCLRPTTLLLLLPVLMLAECVAWVYALKRGPAYLAAKGRAWGWLLAHRRRIAAAHRQTQATRRVGDAALLAAMTWRLDLAQLAGPALGRLADLTLNPLFRLWYGCARALLASKENRTN